jgi:hypothetical protein
MCILPELTRQRFLLQLESAAAVLFSDDSGLQQTPSELARARGVNRSTIYRRTATLLHRVSELPRLQDRVSELSTQNYQLQQRVEQLESRLAPYQNGHWGQVTPQRFAMAALEMAARGHSTEDSQAVPQTAFALDKPPSDGTLFAIIDQGARLAEELIEQTSYHYPLDAIEFDELFHANLPLLAVVEPCSMSLVLLEQFDDYRAETWQFALEYRGIVPPERMIHDCSKQGNLLAKLSGRSSQLCVFHRLRNIKKELQPQLDRLFEKALEELDEPTWERAEWVEKELHRLAELTHPIDSEKRKLRRAEGTQQELREWCREFMKQAAILGLKCGSVENLEKRAEQYVNHLKLWEQLAQEVEYIEGWEDMDGYVLLDALVRVKAGADELKVQHQWEPGSERYWRAQEGFLRDCARLSFLQSLVKNNGAIEKKMTLYLNDLTRTTSRVEALNRRLRGFTDAKRQVTDRQLRLMHLHHNTTRFTADAKRAGKSPWEWLGLEVAGLEDGFVGVMSAASAGAKWPSPWCLKRGAPRR